MIEKSHADWTRAIQASCARWHDSLPASRLQDVTFISKGTFALVYRAQLLREDGSRQLVALKVLRPFNHSRANIRRSFLQEVAVHKLVKHECVIDAINSKALPLAGIGTPATVNRLSES